MKCLVTGSSGLVGSACVEFFTMKGWEIFGLDNNMRSKLFGTPEKETMESIDIRDTEHVNALFYQEGPFDAIIHTAAQPSHDYATDHIMEDFEINAVGTLNMLEATRKYSPNAVFVYVSTDKIYGENLPSDRLATENDGLDHAGIRSFFGCSKAAADMYVQEYGNRFGMKTACFRPGCITGKSHEGAEQHGFLAYVAKCVKEGKLYTIFANTTRDQIHASDLVSAFYEFIKAPKIGAVYNIGGGPDRAITVKDALAYCATVFGLVGVHAQEGEMRPGDRIYDVHDVSKFRKDFPEWEYTYSLQDIINDVCEK